MAYIKPSIISVDGRTIKIAHPTIPEGPKSYLSTSVSATGTTLTLQDNSTFSNGDWIRLGKPGYERSEVVRINGAVTRGTSLTTTACIFDHPIGSEVQKIDFDQWRILGNTTDTEVGASTVATINIQWDEEATIYTNSSTEFAYYKIVGFNSNTSTLSDSYSDGIAKSTGWTEGTVGSIIETAFETTKMERSRVSDRWLFKEINDCLRFVTGKLRRWSFLQVFDYSLGSIVQGTYSFTAPTDIEDANSPKSVLGLRVGTGEDMIYKDKGEWEEMLEDVAYTQVRTQALAGDTTLEIDNSYDFADSGSVDVFVSGTKYNITYTGVTRSTTAGVLTGVPASGTGSITVTTPVDSGVWQNASEGTPAYWTIWDGAFRVWPLADSSEDYQNVLLDYYSKKTSVDSYADTIEAPRYDLVSHWLQWKLRSLNNSDGKPDLTDGDYLVFREILSDLVKLEDGGQKMRWKYRPNGVFYK